MQKIDIVFFKTLNFKKTYLNIYLLPTLFFYNKIFTHRLPLTTEQFRALICNPVLPQDVVQQLQADHSLRHIINN